MTALVSGPPASTSNDAHIQRDLERYLRSEAAPLIIVAHADDEILGTGAQLAHWPAARFVHVTDGAPWDMRDAIAAGCVCRLDYAALRDKELHTALTLAGFGSGGYQNLGLLDQEASSDLAGLSRTIAAILLKLKPNTIITHPYEGGHPDHDGVAFAVSCACTLVQLQTGSAPLVLEMTSYFNRNGLMQTGEFLLQGKSAVTTIYLTEQERRFKQRLLNCYASQQEVLKQFQIQHERFRLAPRYDFSRPPHPGTLFYEQYGLGMNGAQWRAMAVTAIKDLGITS